jgi:cyclic pyranopterin phosphate synthase
MEFSHLTEQGTAKMVDISEKPMSKRVATAEALISLQPETLTKIAANEIAKGNVLTTAQIAAIQAVKRTGELIPLCHPLPIQHAEIRFETRQDGIRIECIATTIAQTGVEMEALVGATVAALTIYDMCKAVDKSMEISGVRLISKIKI